MNEEILKKYSDSEDCPVRNVLDRIGNKWTLLILLVLEDTEVLRFNELHSYIGSISQKMLSVTLKNLESDGLVHRKVYPQIPPKVEYRLTERAHTLLPHIHGLVNWSKEHIGEIKESRVSYEKALTA